MSDPCLKSIAVVLVEPQQPGNIGMACRAMANFGATDLRLVNPCPHLHAEARKFAVAAHPLLESARLYPDLPSAVADLPVAVAATRRSGRLRAAPMDVTAVPGLHRAAPRMGLVFGREDAGLTSEEVAACSHAASIRTSPDCPSLNLAQAVLTFLYELARPAAEATPAAPAERPPLGEMEQMFRQMEQVLERIALLNPARPGQGTYPLRRLIHRASPDREEVALLRSMWNQLAWSINDWRGRKRGQ